MGRETLPPGWEQRRSAKGSTYYVCLHSMRSQWTRPTAPLQEQAGANSARPTNVRWETDAHGEPSPVRAMGGDVNFHAGRSFLLGVIHIKLSGLQENKVAVHG